MSNILQFKLPRSLKYRCLNFISCMYDFRYFQHSSWSNRSSLKLIDLHCSLLIQLIKIDFLDRTQIFTIKMNINDFDVMINLDNHLPTWIIFRFCYWQTFINAICYFTWIITTFSACIMQVRVFKRHIFY